VFPRATKKTREVRFFLTHLREDNLQPEAVECYLSALLNAGKTVTYVLHAEIPKPRKYDDTYGPWHNALSPGDRDLFDLLQELRDLEVHRKGGTEVVSRIEMRSTFETRRSGPNTPIVAQYLAFCMYGSEVTVGVPAYLFQVGGAAETKAIDLFNRVNEGGPIDIVVACGQYADLLEGLVGCFVQALAQP